MDVDVDRICAAWRRYGPRRSLSLVGVIALVWVVEVALHTLVDQDTMRALVVVPPTWPLERPWTGLTNVLGHRDPTHLAVNLIAVVPAGWIAEKHLSSRRWWGLFLVAGGFAGVTQAWVSGNGAVGASGGLAALLAVSLVAGMRWYCRGVRLSETLTTIFVVSTVVGVAGVFAWLHLWGPDDIGHVSHLVGFGLGTVATGWWIRASASRP